MPTTNKSGKLIIIGAGIAGLSAGVYAQRCGYQSRIYEMHTLPGGLLTAWKRKGYTIDGCVQYLSGSTPKSNLYAQYEELGLIQNRSFFDPDVFLYFEDQNGHTLPFYTNLDKLEKELLGLGPEDKAIIHEFCSAARRLVGFNPPTSGSGSLMKYIMGSPSMLPQMVFLGPLMLKWTAMNMSQFAARFKSPFLHQIFQNLWQPEMTVISLLFFLAYVSDKMDGYPIGGSLPMALAVEKHYRELGGEIHYGCRVDKILVEENRAVGVRLTDETEERADYVISAADGHATIWDMLGGQYLDDRIRKVYRECKPFPPLVIIGIGVHQTFSNLPCATGGTVIEIKQPFEVAGKLLERLKMTIYNFDPTLAPAGRTLVKVKIETCYDYWKNLVNDRNCYEAEKDRIATEVIRRLDDRFPGLASRVEMVDVATPVTFERYTGNWQASYEGFLPTPQSVRVAIPMTLPGLDHFYMAGQWVRAGGGIPTSINMGREAIQQICKKDRVKFHGK
jgi:phytoene dehydrogenase-like protein